MGQGLPLARPKHHASDAKAKELRGEFTYLNFQDAVPPGPEAGK